MTRKPRSTTIQVDLGAPYAVSEISMGPDGAIVFKQGGEEIRAARSQICITYERPKGPRVLNDIPSALGAPNRDPNQSLLSYPNILACDTNTADVNGVPVSVASVFELEREGETPSHTLASLRPRVAFEFRGVTGPPERLGWVHALTSLRFVGEPQPVALIVDAHYGDLAGMNDGRKPLLGQFFLPPWATLVYASSDVGKEYVANRLIADADTEASGILAGIRGGLIGDQGLFPSVNRPYSHFRMWVAVQGARRGLYRVAERPAPA
jgi:hypothetical protein